MDKEHKLILFGNKWRNINEVQCVSYQGDKITKDN